MRHRLPQFNHLFTSDAYSAGYYSYLWSEVMDADTREAFAEAGDVFDQATADRLRKYILAPGQHRPTAPKPTGSSAAAILTLRLC